MLNQEKLIHLIARNSIQIMPEWDGVQHFIVRITPSIATEMLTYNLKNRSKKHGSLNAYSSEMLRGGWVYAGDPIRFDSEGNLIDGQHRLTAIANAGEVAPEFYVDAMVITGLSSNVKAVIDSGAKRAAQDQLMMILGTKNASLIASMLKNLLVYDAGLLFKSSLRHPEVATTPIIVNWVDSHPEEVEFISGLNNGIVRSHMTPSIVATATLLFARIDKGGAETFVKRLSDGSGLESGSPILALRERAITKKMNKNPDIKRDQLGLLIKTWNAWRKGESLKLIKIPVGGFTEKNFPKPI